MSIVEITKNMGIQHNVTLLVRDANSGEIVQSHVGHNMATNTLLFGIARYLVGYGVLGQGESTLTSFIPQYISLGTMGLKSFDGELVDGVMLPVLESTYNDQYPGYGSDGYDAQKRNNRKYDGLGLPYTGYSNNATYKVNDTTTFEGKRYKCIRDQDVTGDFSVMGGTYWEYMEDVPVGRELIIQTRPSITFRDIEDEMHAELPYTVDAIFSGMVSTGALAEYRGDRDYLFITEAGLWSKRTWSNSGENGLLAGYRLMPANKVDYTDPIKVRKSVLRVGLNQVVQVIWKIQIGSMDDLIRNYIKTN